MLVKSLTLPGLLELAQTRTPTQLVICEKDRVLPTPRYTRLFTEQLPSNTKVTTLDGVGHVPMYEAPQRIADVIADFVDAVRPPQSWLAPGGLQRLVERLARPHHRRGLLRVRVVVAADVDRISLHLS